MHGGRGRHVSRYVQHQCILYTIYMYMYIKYKTIKLYICKVICLKWGKVVVKQLRMDFKDQTKQLFFLKDKTFFHYCSPLGIFSLYYTACVNLKLLILHVVQMRR